MAEPDLTPKAAFLQGFWDAAPALIGVVPFGLITGVSAVSIGMPALEATAMSAVVFAGASQLAALQLLGTGASIWVIWLTTTMINLRMVMYSASLAPHLKRYRFAVKLPIAYLLTDQAYAFSIHRFSREPGMAPKPFYYFGAASPIWFVWMGATVAGIVLGAQLPESWTLEFAIPLMFMALMFPAITDRASAWGALTGGSVAVLGHGLPYNLGLIGGALAGIAIGLMSERLQR